MATVTRRIPVPGRALALCAALAAGCSGGPKGPPAPKIVPEEAARQALADYDANKDGALDAKELEASPALKGAVAAIDQNGDGRLTADEIAARLTRFQKAGMMTPLSCEVSLDGEPLAGARVTLVPEKFLGPEVQPAAGTTNAAGSAELTVEGLPPGMVHLGYFRVEVSRKGDGGRELIPPRYNAKTVLGCEVAPEGESRGAGGVLTLQLKSR
jgi:EF hand